MDKENSEITLKMRVKKETKELFKNQFLLSTSKTYNDFILSLLDKSAIAADDKAKPGKMVNDKSKDVNSKLTVRLKESEKAFLLDNFYNSSEKRIGAYIAKCVMKARIVVEHVTRIAMPVDVELNRIGTNINQIALRANQYGVVDKEALRMLADISSTLLALRPATTRSPSAPEQL